VGEFEVANGAVCLRLDERQRRAMMAQETTAGLAKQSILHQTTLPLSECQTAILFGAGRRTYKTDHSHSIVNERSKLLI